MHLAHFNIARLRASLEHPSMQGFRDGLAPINQLADRSPDFVWRLKDEDSDDSMRTRPYEDERIAITLSVWESVDALRDFVYRSHHGDYLRQRAAWFEPMQEPSLVLWWIGVGERPTVEQAKERLERLRREGPSPEAFTFRDVFESASRERL